MKFSSICGSEKLCGGVGYGKLPALRDRLLQKAASRCLRWEGTSQLVGSSPEGVAKVSPDGAQVLLRLQSSLWRVEALSIIH